MGIVFIIASILFFSCSSESDPLHSRTNENNSIRSSIEQSKNSIQWVGEDEQGSEQISRIENDTWESTSSLSIDGSDNISLFLQHFPIDAAVYPYLDGFASLNTNSMPEGLYTFIQDFILGLTTNDLDTSFFSEDTSFLKTIIQYDFQKYPAISHHIIGEAFLFDNPPGAYEIPIRLFFENGYVDCLLYCMYRDSTYTIEQLDIGTIKYE